MIPILLTYSGALTLTPTLLLPLTLTLIRSPELDPCTSSAASAAAHAAPLKGRRAPISMTPRERTTNPNPNPKITLTLTLTLALTLALALALALTLTRSGRPP